MARIPLVKADDPDVDPKAAALLLAAENAQDVPVLNVHRALANHPDAMEAFMRLAEIVYFDNGLNPVQSELAYYTSAVTNSCFY
jgi:alkylhydroperoxidase family enzyme